jgi:selenocysteine-specific translation elongation factor
MKHLAVGVFQDDTLIRELGKKDTESDIVMANRKADDAIFTFMSPVEDKLPPKSQIASSIDAAIVTFSSLTKELGETVVMLDSLGVSEGVVVSSPYATAEQVSAITKGTSLESFRVENRDPIRIIEHLKQFHPNRDTSSPGLVVVDHAFSVKGVGEVILGFVRRGIVRKFDKLRLLPSRKEVLVRSIQIQDEDFEEAGAGTRVGLALKGVDLDDLKRGAVLCAADGVKLDTKVRVSYENNRFYAEGVRVGAFHVTVGMQTVPITIVEKSDGSITFESDRAIVYSPQDVFLLLDLNGKRMRVMGKGRVQPAEP